MKLSNPFIYLILLLCTIFGNWNISYSKDAKSELTAKILIANVSISKTTDSLSKTKVEAAINFAANMTTNIEIADFRKIDSIIALSKDQNKKITALEIAKELGCNKIMFVSVNQLEKLLRVEFSIADTNSSVKKMNGVGYSLLNYWSQKTEKPFYDPVILAASQRAFCEAFNTNFYETQKGDFYIKPAKLLAIGCIKYNDNPQSEKWELFEEKVTTSYFGCESIFEIAKGTKDYVVIDLPTRDSMFTKGKLYGIENYDNPNKQEIDLLEKMDVKYYIWGQLDKKETTSNLTLYLCSIHDSGIEVLTKVEDILKEDSKLEYQKLIQSLTIKLLKMGKK